MTNVSKAMEYATTFEREAMREKLDAALGDIDHMNLIQLQEVVLRHEKEIQELKQWVTMQQMPTKICGPNLVGILNSAGFYKKEPEMSIDKDYDEYCKKMRGMI